MRIGRSALCTRALWDVAPPRVSMRGRTPHSQRSVLALGRGTRSWTPRSLHARADGRCVLEGSHARRRARMHVAMRMLLRLGCFLPPQPKECAMARCACSLLDALSAPRVASETAAIGGACSRLSFFAVTRYSS